MVVQGWEGSPSISALDSWQLLHFHQPLASMEGEGAWVVCAQTLKGKT